MDFHRLLRVALLQDHQLSPAPAAQLWPLRPRGTALAWEKSGGAFGREATGKIFPVLCLGFEGVLFLVTVMMFEEDMYNYLFMHSRQSWRKSFVQDMMLSFAHFLALRLLM